MYKKRRKDRKRREKVITLQRIDLYPSTPIANLRPSQSKLLLDHQTGSHHDAKFIISFQAVIGNAEVVFDEIES